jgi:hypothetical protein
MSIASPGKRFREILESHRSTLRTLLSGKNIESWEMNDPILPSTALPSRGESF